MFVKNLKFQKNSVLKNVTNLILDFFLKSDIRGALINLKNDVSIIENIYVSS